MSQPKVRLRRSTLPAAPAVKGEVVVPPAYRADAKDYLADALMAGRSMRDICSEPDMPSEATVRRWMIRDAAFNTQITDALRARVLAESHRLLDIADGIDAVEDVPRSKLRVDTRLKMLSKLDPTVWGDKMELGHTVTGELAAMMAEAKNRGHHLPKAAQ